MPELPDGARGGKPEHGEGSNLRGDRVEEKRRRNRNLREAREGARAREEGVSAEMNRAQPIGWARNQLLLRSLGSHGTTALAPTRARRRRRWPTARGAASR
jgi:hypothetical protein